MFTSVSLKNFKCFASEQKFKVLIQDFVIIQWLNFTTEHTVNDPSC